MLKFWKAFPNELRESAQALVAKSEYLVIAQNDDNGVLGWCVVPSADQGFWLGQWRTAKAALRAVKPLNINVREVACRN